ncbi:MotE family protein [Ensifer soli]|uniref:MotE family protein n=1 Tax=Ciceribacter sp. sgz301302 TaxID=3342379 RepID=UPI0035B9DA4F
MTIRPDLSGRTGRALLIGAALLAALSIPGAYAEDQGTIEPVPLAASGRQRSEVEQFCGNIADAARDQRYLLQKQELETLQAEVDKRIALLEQRRDEYRTWLKRREDFQKLADENLVAIYKNMKADAAAGKLDQVNSQIAAAIIMKLPARQSSLILSEMTNDKAASITNIMSRAAEAGVAKEPS